MLGLSNQPIQEELQKIMFTAGFSQMFPVDLKKLLCPYEAAQLPSISMGTPGKRSINTQGLLQMLLAKLWIF